MLTIFEYLRKLARDSVMAGVQDAVELLDRKPPPANIKVENPPRVGPGQPAPTVATENPQPSLFDAQKYLAGPAVATDATDALPPPRRRGRPPKSGEPG